MKHPFIIFGSLGTAVVIGAVVWIYFVLFYTHSVPSHTTPSPFSVASSSKGFDTLAQERAVQEASATQPVATSGARLLTLRKTIGAVGLGDGTYRFVEAGTGHVYQVDAAGSETKISGTTFPGARRAVWSHEGMRVAIVREINSEALETFVGVLQKNDAGAIALEGAVVKDATDNVSYSESGDTLFYTYKNTIGISEGSALNLKTNKTQTLFTTPLHNIVVSWEPTTIISTKPSAVLPGFAYTKDGARITESINALSVKQLGDAVVFSGQNGTELTSWIRIGSRIVPLSGGIIPEKCTRGDKTLVCAVPSNFDAGSYPDAWYRGEISYSDSLQEYDMETGSSTPFFDFETNTKKQIDVRAISIVKGGYLLEGKNDGSLWLVRKSVVLPPQ